MAILADLQGPKIRLGRFAGGPVELMPGDPFVITTEDVDGDATPLLHHLQGTDR
ncbi:MAG: hypothetical protein WKF83_03830 [Nocardioidaceae bacterium]